MDSYDTFESFSQLPSELRIKIWKSCFPEPRVLPVRFQRTFSKYVSNEAPPALLHACHESRSLFLETYAKLILNPKYDSAVFIDFTCDTLFFDTIDCSPDGDLSLDIAASPHRDRILHCAIDSQLWEVLRVFKFDNLSEVRMMPNLKTMALVMAKDRELHQRRVDVDGHEGVFVDADANTVESEIRHVHYYVDQLRWELRTGMEKYWSGVLPHVQMWLW